MAWNSGLTAVTGHPTRTSQYNDLVENPEYLQVATDVDHDVPTASATGYHDQVTFTGDTDTKITNPSADTIAFDTGGTEAMRIDSSQNVGIGTTAPGGRLEIAKSAASTPVEISTWSTTDSHYPYLVFQKSSSATINTLATTSDNENLGIIFANGVNSAGTPATISTSYISFEQDGAATPTFVPGRILFYTGTGTAAAAEAMRIDSAKNVGIGVTPSGKLDVVDTSTAAGITGRFERNKTGNVAASNGVLAVVLKTDADMQDGGGPSLAFAFQDTGQGSDTYFGSIAGIRDGADTEGALKFSTGTSGGEETMRLSGGAGTAILDLVTTGNRIDFDDDGDTSIRAIADDVLTFEAGAVDFMAMTATTLSIGGTANATGAELEVNAAAPVLAIRDTSTTITAGDEIGRLAFYGDDPSATHLGAFIKVIAKANWATDDYGTDMDFWVTEDDTAAPVSRFRIRDDGVVHVQDGGQFVVGHTNSVVAAGGVKLDTQILGTGNTDSSFVIGRWSNDASSPSIRFVKSREAAIGDYTAGVDAGDSCGSINWYVDDTTDSASRVAYIAGKAAANTAADNTPGYLVFATTESGSGSPTEHMRLDAPGNLGIGVTPSGWLGTWTGLQVGGVGALSTLTAAAAGSAFHITTNANLDTDSSWEYLVTDEATDYYQQNGTHVFRNAASGTAGNDITWADVMILDAAGNMGLGVTPQGTNASFTSVSLGGNGFMMSHTAAGAGNGIWITQNLNYDTDGSWEYIITDEASSYDQSNGVHRFRCSVSGTAGTDATQVDVMKLDVDSVVSLSNVDAGTSNTIFGKNAGDAIAAGGNYNAFFGEEAGGAVSTGDNNAAFGYGALDALTTASNMTAVGYGALGATTAPAAPSTAVGAAALALMTGDGINNTAVGFAAAGAVTTGDSITVVGSNSCTTLTTGGTCTIIGAGSDVSAATAAGQIVIGDGLAGTADSRVHIGDGTSHIYNDYNTNNTWTHSSDERQKRNIQDNELGLDFLLKIKPRTFQLKAQIDMPKEWFPKIKPIDMETEAPENWLHGFVAQEVKEAMDQVGCKEFAGWDVIDTGRQQVSFEAFVPPIVSAIQELSKKDDELESEIELLKEENRQLRQEIERLAA